MESDRVMMLRFLTHLLGTLALMATSVLAAIAFVGNTVGAVPESNLLPPRLNDETFRKFNEFQVHDDLDLLFVGSSHAMRAFDPRYFSNLGLSTFNLGTRAQTPVITQHLLKALFDQVDPDLIVMEIYWAMLDDVGAESAVDLIENGPVAFYLFPMIWDVRSTQATLSAVRRLTLTGVREDSRLQPTLAFPGTFVGRGYREMGIESVGDTLFDARSIIMSKSSRVALRAISEYVRSRGSQPVFVTAPMPRYTLQNIDNLSEIRLEFRSFADSIDVRYIDFTTNSDLTGVENFYDYGHLNQRGTDLFMPVLIDSLLRVAPGVFEGR